jgi:hypothetical protein
MGEVPWSCFQGMTVKATPSTSLITIALVGMSCDSLLACDQNRLHAVPSLHESPVKENAAAPPPPVLAKSDLRHEAMPPCVQCAIEDLREAAHRDQVEVTARYLGLKGRWLDGQRTHRTCTREEEVTGVVRFSLLTDSPWRDELPPSPAKRNLATEIEVDLPCPELSRPAYAKLYRYDPDDSQRDGLGHAAVLRRGEVYQLTFVRDPRTAMREPSHPSGSRLVPTLVAVNPRRPIPSSRTDR